MILSADNAYIADGAQTTNMPGIVVFNTQRGPNVVTGILTDKATGKKRIAPKDQLSTFSYHYRVMCDRLPKNSRFEVVLAVAHLPLAPDGSPISTPADPLFGPKPNVSTIYVSGTYQSVGEGLGSSLEAGIRLKKTNYIEPKG